MKGPNGLSRCGNETPRQLKPKEEDIHATTAGAIYSVGPEAVTKEMYERASEIRDTIRTLENEGDGDPDPPVA